jgi:hypothetical protein
MGSHRTHVILPEKLIAEIDALVGQRRRSAFLAEVAEREVKRRRLIEFLSSKEPVWDPADHPEIEAAGGAAAWVRKMRQAAGKASRRRAGLSRE